MARAFVKASVQSLVGNAPVTTYPLTIVARLNCAFDFATPNLGAGICELYNSSNSTHYFRMNVDNRARVSCAAGASAGQSFTTGNPPGNVTVGSWRAFGYICTSATSRTLYYNTAVGTNTNNRTPTGIDKFAIGFYGSSNSNYFEGSIADVAIWNVALTTAEDMTMYQAGVSPLLIRPDALVAYWPLIGRYDPEIDIVGGFNLTLNNSPTAGDHPRIYWPGWNPVVDPPRTDSSFVNDTLKDSDSITLASHNGDKGMPWVIYGGTSASTVSANWLTPPSSESTYYATGTPTSAEYDVSADFVYEAGNGDAAVLARVDTAGDTFYLLQYNTGAGQWRMYKKVSGSYTSLGTYTQSLTPGATYRVKFEIRNATKKAFIDGVERISSGDNAITAAGKAGLRFDGSVGTTLHLANFRAENVTVSTFTATGAASVTKVTAAGSATFVGLYTATGAASSSHVTAAATATFVPPTFTGSAAATAKSATAAASATFSPGTKTATGAVSAQPATASASGTVAVPVYTATAAATVSRATCSAAATFTPPTFAATAAVTASKATASAAATATAPTYTGSATVTTSRATAAATASHVAPSYTGDGSVTSKAATASGSATFATATFAATAATTTAAATASGSATFAPGTKTATGAATAKSATAAGTATFTPLNNLRSGLISYWKLDETSGTRYDSKGDNHLTDNNTVGSATGIKGNAADFELDNSESLSINDNNSLRTGDIDWSFACWIKPETNPVIAGIAGKNSGTTSQREWALQMGLGVPSFVSYYDNGTPGAGQSYVEWPDALTVGTWNFIVVWHDNAANEIAIQVNNGTPVTASHPTGGNVGTAPFALGRLFSGLWYFDGLIDEAMLAKRVWDSDERSFLYNGGSGRTYEELSGGGEVFTSTGAVTVSRVAAAASGTTTAPTYTATAAATVSRATASGVAAAVSPAFTASATVTVGRTVAEGSGTTTVPVYGGSGALSVSRTTASASATHSVPVYAGTGALTTTAATASATASHVRPTFSAAASVTVSAITAAGSGTFEPGTKTATGAVIVNRATALGEANFIGLALGAGSVIVSRAIVSIAGRFIQPVPEPLPMPPGHNPEDGPVNVGSGRIGSNQASLSTDRQVIDGGEATDSSIGPGLSTDRIPIKSGLSTRPRRIP